MTTRLVHGLLIRKMFIECCRAAGLDRLARPLRTSFAACPYASCRVVIKRLANKQTANKQL
jgi:hypothetical protein